MLREISTLKTGLCAQVGLGNSVLSLQDPSEPSTFSQTLTKLKLGGPQIAVTVSVLSTPRWDFVYRASHGTTVPKHTEGPRTYAMQSPLRSLISDLIPSDLMAQNHKKQPP